MLTNEAAYVTIKAQSSRSRPVLLVMSIQNNFYDDSDPQDIPPDLRRNDIPDYSPDIISYYYGDPNIPCDLSQVKIPGLPPLASYFPPAKGSQDYYNFGMPSENYYCPESRYHYVPNYDVYNLEAKSYRSNQVSTYVTNPVESAHDHSRVQLSTAGNGKSPLDTFDNLINLRLKSFKHSGSFPSKASPEPCPQMKTNSVHMIEQWKKEREILQKLFPEHKPEMEDNIMVDEEYLESGMDSPV